MFLQFSYGNFDKMCEIFWSGIDNLDHTVITYGDIDPSKPVAVRVHSQCFTGSFWFFILLFKVHGENLALLGLFGTLD